MKICPLTLLVGAILLVHLPMSAQVVQGLEPGHAYLAREDLQEMLVRLDQSALSRAYTAVLRARIREQAELLRARLQVGDFQVGDRIVLEVEDRQILSDTFTVDQGRVLTLPTIGDVPLTGVLRSELKGHISAYLERFLREPVVRARALIHIAILGGVGRPGFYTVAGEALLSDAVMLAGGPANAKVDEIRIERGDETIWEPRQLQVAIANRRTLDELNLQAGDRIFVPRHGGGLGDASAAVQVLGFVVALPLTVAGLIQVF